MTVGWKDDIWFDGGITLKYIKSLIWLISQMNVCINFENNLYKQDSHLFKNH